MNQGVNSKCRPGGQNRVSLDNRQPGGRLAAPTMRSSTVAVDGRIEDDGELFRAEFRSGDHRNTRPRHAQSASDVDRHATGIELRLNHGADEPKALSYRRSRQSLRKEAVAKPGDVGTGERGRPLADALIEQLGGRLELDEDARWTPRRQVPPVREGLQHAWAVGQRRCISTVRRTGRGSGLALVKWRSGSADELLAGGVERDAGQPLRGAAQTELFGDLAVGGLQIDADELP